MGNICSSGQNKNQDSSSERSDASYRIENTARDRGNSVKSELNSQLKAQENIEENISTKLNNQATKFTKTQDTSKTLEQTSCVDHKVLDTGKENLSADLCKLLGKTMWNKDAVASKMRKIVLYFLMDNSSDSLKYKRLLYNLQADMEKQCAVHNFEFVIADVHNASEHFNQMARSKTDAEKLMENIYYDDVNVRKCYEESVVCLSEMRRHSESNYIIPVLIFGTSMGVPLLPSLIESNDFLKILNSSSADDERLLLEKWYVRDDDNCDQGAMASYRLHIEHLENIQNEPNKELNTLLQILMKCSLNKILKSSYITTIIELELNNIILNNSEIAKRTIWIQFDPQYAKMQENVPLMELEMQQRLMQYHVELKNCIMEKNLIRIPANVDVLESELISIFRRVLETSIQCIIEEHLTNFSITHNTNGIDHTLINELEFIHHYGNSIRSRCTIKQLDSVDSDFANVATLNEVKSYIENSAEHPLIIYGPMACGKSVLCSIISTYIHEWKSNVNVVLRYAKLTAESSDLVTMLGSIVNQMSVIVNGYQIKMERSLDCYTQTLCDIIESRKYFIVIILDSIDELLDDDDDNMYKNLNWLPMKLHGMCKIILTITEGKSNYNELMELFKNRNLPEAAFIKMNALSERQWSKMLNTNHQSDFKKVPRMLRRIPQQWYELCEHTMHNAKSLCWLSHMGISTLTANDIRQISMFILSVLETKLSTEYTEILLLIICLPKWGIRESDCLSIFKTITKLDTQTIFNEWAKFCYLIQPIILDIEHLFVMDSIFKNVVLKKYQNCHRSIHTAIRDYYEKQENDFVISEGPTIKIYNRAKYMMVPYHHFHILIEDNMRPNVSNNLFVCVYITDLQWIANKVRALGPAHLIHDILIFERIAKDFISPKYNHIKFLKDFLSKYSHELYYDGDQFFTLFKYYLKVVTESSKDSDIKSDEKILSWLQYVEDMKSPYLEILTSGSNDTDDGACVYDALVNLPNDGYFMASLSVLREEVCIWDVQQCTRVRVLQGIPHPTAMCPFGDHDAAILCRREIKVINMDNGKFKVTLKGVMNQKMPYFGLHDQKHLVCLSRNRMYVNLMNLESGDCVTTFKAGEDRFLNSLLVSGDGRILVCGDETQKPFPLLVWHLSQRKLLYDLRIPCHDFITSLSAITYEGSYVCAVAKELNDPAPNFIVVYDLQSGTLFKKWKPTCNTVSLAISQLNACVIAGLYDAKILIWDLVTGNCRATLVGHNAPVTCLKLDPLGQILLSTNKDGLDNALRLWELSSGNSLAIFKPPGRVSACEILPNGSFVAIALFGQTDLLILALKNYTNNATKSISNNAVAIYGKEDNQHKVFKLEIT